MSDSKVTYKIHPAIGFARVGNAPDAFYLEPTGVGKLPTEWGPDGEERPVTEFKQDGQVKRQAARFRVYRYEEGKAPQEVWAQNGLESLTWTVHVANKKAAWYNFAELQGDVMLPDNTYSDNLVPLRNATVGSKTTQPGEPCCEPQPVAPPPGGDVTRQYDRTARQQLIIDPGPRTLTGPSRNWVLLDAGSAGDYKYSFPPADLTPYPVTTLGSVRMTEHGELLPLYDRVYREFAKLVQAPDLAMPWPAWYELDGRMPATVALSVPTSVLPSQITRISLGPAIMSMPTTPNTRRFAAATYAVPGPTTLSTAGTVRVP